MKIIESQKHNVPWRWVIILGLAGVPYMMLFMMASGEWGSLPVVVGINLENEAWLGPLMSMDFIFNIFVGTTCLYISDRIWTRLGRRKPFFLTAWFGTGVSLLFIPFATSTPQIVVLVIMLFAVMDASTTVDMLVYETIPPHQRGRYEAVKSIYLHIIIVIFALAVGGRIFERVEIHGMTVTGITGIFWFGAISIFIGATCMATYVKENKPEITNEEEHDDDENVFYKLARPIRALIGNRYLWPVYMLAFCMTLVQITLGPYGYKLITEQWGYTMQDINTNIIIGSMLNICLLPGIGILADKFNRAVMFTCGITFYVCMTTFYYVYIEFLLPGSRPLVWMMVAFGTCQSIAMLFVGTNFLPLCYDFIPRNMMATALAGINLLRYGSKALLMAPMGAFIAWTSGDGPTNYMNAYMYIITGGVIGCLITYYFMIKVKRGDLIPVGRDGYETESGEEIKVEQT